MNEFFLLKSQLFNITWRREWPPTPVFLPGEFHGQRSLTGYSPWDRRELEITEQLRLSLFFDKKVKALQAPLAKFYFLVSLCLQQGIQDEEEEGSFNLLHANKPLFCPVGITKVLKKLCCQLIIRDNQILTILCELHILEMYFVQFSIKCYQK